MKLLGITFKYAPQSCDNGTVAMQGLLGFSSLFPTVNCSILTEFNCFAQVPPCLSKHSSPEETQIEMGRVTLEEQPGDYKTISLLPILSQDPT